MQSQGELMQILGDISATGKDLRKDIESLSNELDMGMRSIRNKALTEAITVGYEARQALGAAVTEAKDSIQSAVNETKESITTAVDEIWEHLDRYL